MLLETLCAGGLPLAREQMLLGLETVLGFGPCPIVSRINGFVPAGGRHTPSPTFFVKLSNPEDMFRRVDLKSIE